MNCVLPSFKPMASAIPVEPIDAYAGWLDVFKKKKKKKDPTLTGLMIKSEKQKLKDIQERQKLAAIQAEREEAESVQVLGQKVGSGSIAFIALVAVAIGGFVYFKSRKKK